ncbi:MAG: exonuclease SbcCD subunit D [Peptoniphilaceae bacterium]|nr:exonuclease SbcCD subunit D [Peptoniphilaceae bacterium]MDD7383308.1 exonuclease SbcCD subunit D [Peptoniphilaceae bacterium]MDY3738321.1 exonuclease SbcCD subunit D [Peptoniphilaceae bacterium]
MKLLHLSDLHLGKNIGSYSLIEEQKYALDKILEIIKDEDIDVVMIAGDIFDTNIASSEALELYSYFIEKVVFSFNKKVLAISGNHDSSKRLDINRKFYRSQNYYMVGKYDPNPITFYDFLGPVNFYLIPFISINKAKTEIDSNIENFTDIYKKLLENIKYKDRNVLITHAYASDLSNFDEKEYNLDQKPLNIGGSDAMDVNLFMNFDYVALGHLHRAHYVKDPKIRYSGTFMKYSFDEANLKKTVTLVDLKKDINIKKLEISPLRDFEVREGKFFDLLKQKSSENYIKFVLEDDFTIENAMAKLKEKFPKAVSITYANRSVFNKSKSLDIDIENKDIIEIFSEFYKYKMDEEIKDDDLVLLKRIEQCDQKN